MLVEVELYDGTYFPSTNTFPPVRSDPVMVMLSPELKLFAKSTVTLLETLASKVNEQLLQ